MEPMDIEKELADFEAKLKPLNLSGITKPAQPASTPKVVKKKPEPAAPVPEPVMAVPAEQPGVCLSEAFKTIIAVLPAEFIGNANAQFFILSQPDCPVVGG